MTNEPKATHTPGPWRQTGDFTVQDSRGNRVARTGMARPHAENEANARLIAAAPDLLALAKQYASECAHCNGTGREPTLDVNGFMRETVDCAPCADIRAVIDKAVGRQ